MHKSLLATVIAVFALVGTVQAKDPKVLKTEIDLFERFGHPTASGIDGYVVIDTVSLARTLPAGADNYATLSPSHVDTQIGWFKRKDREYLIVLKGTTIEQYVRDAITLGFDQVGYAVVSAEDSRAATALRVNVEVTSLWLWTTPTGKLWGHYEFHFEIGTIITSDSYELAKIGSVKASGSRKGQRVKSWKSYRNAALHTMKPYLNQLEEKIRESVEAAKSVN